MLNTRQLSTTGRKEEENGAGLLQTALYFRVFFFCRSKRTGRCLATGQADTVTKAYMRRNAVFADAARVIQTITNTPVEIQEEEEKVDMCKGIEELMEKSRAEGVQMGRAEGVQTGREEGREEGRKEGRKEGETSGALRKAKETACALAGMGLPTEQIASAVGTELEVVKEWILS